MHNYNQYVNQYVTQSWEVMQYEVSTCTMYMFNYTLLSVELLWIEDAIAIQVSLYIVEY